MAEASDLDVKVLVMCGGKGTRMWPISNVSHPKQFESFLGEGSMFRQTIRRALKGFNPQDIYVATSDKFAEFLKEQAPEVPEENFILEPAMRDNLGAIALATSIIHHRHPNSVMFILWGADHVVRDEEAFIAAAKDALVLANEHDKIVHIDTFPTYPTVHNGWIQIGEKVMEAGGKDVFTFIRQVEKPNLETAKEFMQADNYLIHTGYMATKPSLLLSYYEQYAPEAFAIASKIAPTIDTPDFDSTLAEYYPQFEKTAIDLGLFEKLPSGSQLDLPISMGWIDVGTWELLYHGMDKDEHGNVVIGDAELINVTNSLIISKQDAPTGIIGVDEMVVVQTDGGLLVCPMKDTPLVKELYNKLYSS